MFLFRIGEDVNKNKLKKGENKFAFCESFSFSLTRGKLLYIHGRYYHSWIWQRLYKFF